MSSLSFYLVFAKIRFFFYKRSLFVRLGGQKSDRYIRSHALTMLDFLPELPYSNGEFKAIPRKHTDDFNLLFLPREEVLKPHLKLNANEIFVDVGANVGAYSLQIACSFDSIGVNVIAIEADLGNYEALTRNIRVNRLKNIEALNLAVSDHSGSVHLYEHVIMDDERDRENRVQTGHYSLCKTFDGGFYSDIKCDTLDNILEGRNIGLLKIDIEGAELLALQGASNTLRKTRKVIVEIHQDNLLPVSRILKDNQFRLAELEGSDGMKYLVGTR